MAYDSSDPRSRLGGASATAASAFGTAEYVKFYETAAQITSEVESTWLSRGQNFTVAYSEVSPGAVLERSADAQPDEYFLLLPEEDTDLTIHTDKEEVRVEGRKVVIVPPGQSSVKIAGGRRVVRVFSTLAEDLAAASPNADSYVERKPNIPEFQLWPEPIGGYRIRVYELDIPQEEGRFGRIWRSRNIMVNYSEKRMGPRDVTKMSPHVHDDFEQCSLVLDGTFVHHLRWPWTTDMRVWREDEHEICAGPSVTVIPPKSIHTSQQVSQGLNQLVDIFAPPRFDFSNMEGWVLNADEYPMPSLD